MIAFSNNIRKAVKSMSHVFKPITKHGSMRVPRIEYNSFGNNNNHKNRQFESAVFCNDQFGVIGKINNPTKLIGFDDGSNNTNNNHVDNKEVEEEDIDVEFLLCNEKLCKDNQDR